MASQIVVSVKSMEGVILGVARVRDICLTLGKDHGIIVGVKAILELLELWRK